MTLKDDFFLQPAFIANLIRPIYYYTLWAEYMIAFAFELSKIENDCDV